MFEKKGIILSTKKVHWAKFRLWVPTAYNIDEKNIIVYFAGQNKFNESDLGYFIYNTEKNKIKFLTQKPVLKRGTNGSFDDSALVPCHLIKKDKLYYLYYVGWMQGKKVPYLPSLGLAISKKITGPFKKYSLGPILDKNPYDPYFVSSCFVKKVNKKYLMHYTSNTKWEKIRNQFVPRYLIKNCNSNDGINWIRKNNISINFRDKTEMAITRPWLINVDKNKQIMFFSIKKKNYKISYATSSTSNKWVRTKKRIFSKNSMTNYDNISQEYASIVKIKNKLYMFYNGNNYGEKGILLAVSNNNDFR